MTQIVRGFGKFVAGATALMSCLTWLATTSFARETRSDSQMPMAAPPIQHGHAERSPSPSFSLNASKIQEPTTIPRPSFSLDASKFRHCVEQAVPHHNSGAGEFDISAFKQLPLKGEAKTLTGAVQSLRLLANYDIELIVDESLSMRKMDCPGGISRWNWCGMQAGQLAKQLAPYVRNGFTLTTFAGDYKVYNNSTPEHVMQLFQNPDFGKGTRMSDPLADRLNNYFSRRAASGKPLLIAVITDGCPTPRREPLMVADVLIDATRKMRDTRDVTVVFFQIGEADYRGQRFLNYLDNGLLADGACFDIVKNVPMQRLTQIGLAQSLADSMREFAAKGY